MTVVDFLRGHIQRLHRSYDEATQGLTPEQLHWTPGPGCNHIAFVAWHYTRTADNVCRFVLQNRRPTVWLEEGWNERFGLDLVAQGRGMSPEAANAIRIPSAEAFLPYMQKVWQAVDDYLSSLNDSDLERLVFMRPGGTRPIGQILGAIFLIHGFSHLGQIWLMRGMRGLMGVSGTAPF